MKNQFIIIAIFFSLINYHANCQTPIPGGEVSGTWTLAASPYLIQGSIMIANDSVLTIEPGVIINFQGSYLFLILGQLNAYGTIQDSIHFTASDTTVGWLGIRFDNTAFSNDTSKIYFCEIEYGRAIGISPGNCGGAFYFDNFSKAVVSNCSMTNCSAYYGGAIYCWKSSPIIQNNIISNNLAEAGGGGISCLNGSNPLISGNNISYNHSNGDGGAIICYDESSSSPTIINNTISFNVGGWGGAIRCVGSSAIISHNIISNNIGADGAGIYAVGGSSDEIISHNVIMNNQGTSSAYWGGGGIYCSGNSIISDNFIVNNSTPQHGGGIYCSHAHTTFFNNVIANNEAQEGGAVFCSSYSSLSAAPYFFNNTIANNSAQFGGAFFFHSPSITSNATLRNNILWGDSAVLGNEVYIDDMGSKPSFYYCNIQGGLGAFVLDTNVFYLGTYTDNINSDPLFISPSGGCGSSFNGLAANWKLQDYSPCINNGDLTGTYPEKDIADNPRVVGNIIDIGAYEYQDNSFVTYQFIQDQISIFPNPFINSTTIEIENTTSLLQLSIYDMYGKRIRYFNNISGEKIIIERENLIPGIYFYELNIESKEKYTGKLIIID
jgi:hypothetical protein